jgi:hypothetical protein
MQSEEEKPTYDIIEPACKAKSYFPPDKDKGRRENLLTIWGAFAESLIPPSSALLSIGTPFHH